MRYGEKERAGAQQAAIQPRVGMEVYSRDGALLGAISRVWPQPRGQRDSVGVLLEGFPGHPRSEPRTGPHGAWQPYAAGYLELDRGTRGHDRYLYVPFNAVEQQTDDVLVLDVSEAQLAEQGWEIKPHFLGG